MRAEAAGRAQAPATSWLALAFDEASCELAGSVRRATLGLFDLVKQVFDPCDVTCGSTSTRGSAGRAVRDYLLGTTEIERVTFVLRSGALQAFIRRLGTI